MKNILSLIAVLLVVSFFVTSCRKYEEGPNVSLRSKKARVTNNWRIESAELNGTEVSLDPLWAKQKHYMYKDGKYIINIINPITLEARNLQGNWVLYDHDTKIALTTKNFSGNIDSTNEFNILKLYNKQLWIRKIDNSLELHLVPFE
jgi:hypothetical protein